MAKKPNAANRGMKERELNIRVREWKSLPPEGNEARAMNLYGECLLLAMELYDYEDDIEGARTDRAERETENSLNLITDCLEKYDAERGEDFSHYMNYTRSRRKKDWRKKKAEKESKEFGLDQPITEEDGEKFVPEYTDEESAFREEAADSLEAKTMELTAMVLNFSKNHKGKQNNPTRNMWYRMFYTEDMTQICKTWIPHFLHERDMCDAMELSYLDYYMAAECRSFASIQKTRLKPLRDTIPPSPDTAETPVPLPAEVSLCYLQHRTGVKPGNNTRSNFLSPYKLDRAKLSV